MVVSNRLVLLLLLLFPSIRAFVNVGRVAHHVYRTVSPSTSIHQPARRVTFLTSSSDSDDDDNVATVVEKVSGFQGGEIIRPYKPQRGWIWRRWKGTVLRAVLPNVAFNLCVTLFMVVALRKATGASWMVGLKPDTSHPLIARLAIFDKAWKYLVTLTTFTTTFFVSEAYVLWKNVYTVGRQIQGRLNDISLLLATHAVRNAEGRYTPEAQLLLDNVAINIRSFHALLWASCSRHYRCLLTPQGLNLMVNRGLLTQTQLNTLLKLNIPNTQYHNAILEWIMIQVQDAMRDGVLAGGDGLEHVFLEKCCTLRGTYASIGDILDGRMPLAYVHLVQLSVDTLLFTAPLALYAELGAFSVITVGLLTFYYLGLVNLAYCFLDPIDNENFCEETVDIDLSVLIRESNDGSIRWKNGASVLPFSTSSGAKLSPYSTTS